MSEIKDTLTLFDELVAGGAPEQQARVQAHQLGAQGNYVNTYITELKNAITKIDKDLYWMRLIGMAILAALLSMWFK